MENLNKILVNHNATIKQAMKIIDQGAIRIAVVVDEENKLAGIVTDGDIRRGILNGIDINQNVSEVMNKNPVYASTESYKNKILDLLKNEDIFGIPLVDKNNVVQDFVLTEEGKGLTHFSEALHLRKHLDKILVIGGGGYIGSLLVRKLLAKGYKVRVLDKFLYGKESLEGINNPLLEIVEGDTRHIETLTECVKDVDAVVHLAELVGDPACALDPKKTQDINYLATVLIASVCKHYQINRLIYMSSCSVYGATKNDELLHEKSELNPVSLYAKMKISSENVLKEMADSNFSPTILRLSTVYGLSHRPRFDLVVNVLTAKALKEGNIPIFGGEQWRPNVHVVDVAKATILALEAPIEKVGNKVFNVGSEEQNHTINEIGKIVHNEIPSARLDIQDKRMDNRDYRVSFKKIRETLNFTPEMTVAKGVREIMNALEKDSALDYQDPRHSNIKYLKEHYEKL